MSREAPHRTKAGTYFEYTTLDGPSASLFTGKGSRYLGSKGLKAGARPCEVDGDWVEGDWSFFPLNFIQGGL